MKLKKIIIHNIASIEDATIDFEHGPLSQDSRFLICGPTGTGKTTLLDCICLALYCTTPRLRAAARESFTDPSENYANNNRDDVSIDDSRMLMRRGALNAYVHLYFTDKDEVSLKAVWSCRRAHNKANGTIQPYEWFLCDEKDLVIAQRQKAMSAVIPQRIGLTFEQFCRTTLLAQGDFTKFLKSGESEKAEILEKLTGTEIYSEISRRIHQCFGEKESVCQEIRSRLGGVQLLTDEECAEIRGQQQELQQQRNVCAQEEIRWNGAVNWWKQLLNAKADAQQAQQVERLNVEKMQTEEFQSTLKWVQDWDRTVTQREQLRNRNDRLQELQALAAEEVKLRSDYAVLLAGKEGLKLQLEKLDADLQRARVFLEKESSNLPLYQEVNNISTLLQNEGSYRLELKKSEDRLSDLKSKQGRLQQEQGALNLSFEEALRNKAKAEEEYQLGLSQLKALDYEGLLKRQSVISAAIELRKGYEQLLQEYEQLQKTSAKAQQECESEKKEITDGEQSVLLLQAKVKELENAKAAQEQIYEKQKCACEDLMKEYRKQLAVGDRCPLCGQVISDLPSDEHFHSLLQPVKEALVDVQSRLDQTKDAYHQKVVATEGHRRLYKKAEQAYREAALAEEQTATQLKSGELGKLYFALEDRMTVLVNDRKRLETEGLSLQQQLQAVGVQQQKVNGLHGVLDQCANKLQTAQKAVGRGEQLLSEVKAKMEAELQHQQTEQTHLQETLTALEAKVPADRRAEPDFLPQLKEAARKYDRAVELERQWNQQLTVLQGQWEPVVAAQTSIVQTQPSWEKVEFAEPIVLDELPARWSRMVTAVALNAKALSSATAEKEKLDRDLQSYYEQSDAVDEARLSSLLQQSNAQIESWRQEQQQVRDELLRSRDRTQKATEVYDLCMKNRPEMEEEMTLEEAEAKWSLQKESLSRCDQQLGELRQRLEQDAKNHARFDAIHQELQTAENEANRWGRLHELFGSADGKKFRNIAQSYVLTQLLINANQYLRQFTDRYEMVCQPGSLTILLRDNEAGGITRPTTTISGGEGFLISLSLALGLSSLSRASISMDTLFIDEGFGTLDSTYLSAVMDALERLHQMGGKRVGIISHVESLKDRITTQIQVSRVNTTLSKVEVVSLL